MSDANDRGTSHLAGVYREIAETMGLDTAHQMYHCFKGQQITFPIRFYDTNYTAEKIREEYNQGASIRDLSKEYDYTERRIRQLVK